MRIERGGIHRERAPLKCIPREQLGCASVSRGYFVTSPRTTSALASTMRLNLQVPPSAAVAGQAAGLCLALCLNLHPAGVLPALADDGTSGAAVCLSLGQSSHPAPRPRSPSQATHTTAGRRR